MRDFAICDPCYDLYYIFTSSNMDETDPWDAFGDESDDDNGALPVEKSTDEFVQGLTSFLVQHYLKQKIRLGCVAINVAYRIAQEETSDEVLQEKKIIEESLVSRGFLLPSQGTQTVHQKFDAVIFLGESWSHTSKRQELEKSIVRGGVLCLLKCALDAVPWDPHIWQMHDVKPVFASKDLEMVMMQKWTCTIQNHSACCTWLRQTELQQQRERERLQEACVSTNVYEQTSKRLSETSVARAVKCLNQFGYCVIPQLLDPHVCQEWGNAVLSDLDLAAARLLEMEGVDLFQPHLSRADPSAYRELSMREDLRMDLRHGPSLNRTRGASQGNRAWTVTAKTPLTSQKESTNTPEFFFRGDQDVLEIVRRVMNPRNDALYPGNFGRYNFSGSGPDGSYQDIRIGPIGGIISLPGSADQAVHADTPHLFEHLDGLPAHYINLFTPGSPSDPTVGQTAFVHGSHTLEFCAQNTSGDEHSKRSWKSFVVRPFLHVGDVLIFDCRILHFGTPNRKMTFSTVFLRPQFIVFF